MALFFVTALRGSEIQLEATIKEKFPSGVYSVSADKWFIQSDSVTAKEISDKLGLGTPESIPGAGYLVLTVGGYFGVAAPDVWEWLAAKATKPNG